MDIIAEYLKVNPDAKNKIKLVSSSMLTDLNTGRILMVSPGLKKMVNKIKTMDHKSAVSVFQDKEIIISKNHGHYTISKK